VSPDLQIETFRKETSENEKHVRAINTGSQTAKLPVTVSQIQGRNQIK
jgi:hypothetical protein